MTVSDAVLAGSMFELSLDWCKTLDTEAVMSPREKPPLISRPRSMFWVREALDKLRRVGL